MTATADRAYLVRRIQEAPVTVIGRRGDMLQIAVYSASFQQFPDLAVQLPLARVGQVVDGKTGNDQVEVFQPRQGIVKIVTDNLYPGVRGDARARALADVRARPGSFD